MKLAAMLKEIATLAVHGDCDREIAGIAVDSRRVRPGYLFAALPGRTHDGWAFVDDAVKRGAVAVVSAPGPGARHDVCHVEAADPREAAAAMSAVFRGHPDARLQLAAVTGTNGKTTTAYMLRDMLEAAGRKTGLLGTVAYCVGERTIPAGRTTPEAPLLHDLLAQMVRSACDSAVMEVSSHALVQKRTWGVDYDAAVFTNLTRDHLDYHGDMDAYFEAKLLLFRELGRGTKQATAVVNLDDPWGARLAALPDLAAERVTYGLETAADVRAEDVVLGADDTRFRLCSPWGGGSVQLRLRGRFNVSNALAAFAAGGSLGLDIEPMRQAAAGMGCVPGRLEEVPTDAGFQVFVDYAHTDDALEHVLRTLREIATGRLLLVFGCGGNRDRSKRPAMGRVADRLADYTVVTSDNPRKEPPQQIVDDILAGFRGDSCMDVVEDRAAAIARAVAMARPGDIVLVAGKGHESFQEFANKTIALDDREIVRGLLDPAPVP